MALTSVSTGMVNNFSRKNIIINGNFDVWQRGTSQTSSGYGSADRWSNTHSGSTKTCSQQTFTIGQTAIPNNPKYFLRTVTTTANSTGNWVIQSQRIEDVTRFSGKTLTLSFWAKADANRNIATEFVQDFGTGGTPSDRVYALGVVTCALTTSWQKFTVTVTLPSVSGKTLGTTTISYLQLNLWFDGGSTYTDRNNSLGSQSGTFDIAQVQLEEGTAASNFEYRHPSEELQLCCRYYFQHTVAQQGTRFNFPITTISTTVARQSFVVPVPMRIPPTITIDNWSATGLGGQPTATSSSSYSISAIHAIYTGTFTSGMSGQCGVDIILNAEI